MTTSALLLVQGSVSANSYSRPKETKLRTFKNIKYINQGNVTPKENINDSHQDNVIYKPSKNNDTDNKYHSDSSINNINNIFQNQKRKMDNTNRQPKMNNRQRKPKQKKNIKLSHQINHNHFKPIHIKKHRIRRYHRHHKDNYSIKAYKYTNTKLPRLTRLISFPDSFYGGRFPQSINLSRNQKCLYLGFDSYASNGSKIIRYNLKTHRYMFGKTFGGGHAQGVSINPQTNGLWFIDKDKNNSGDDHAGLMNHGRFVEVSTRTLKPIYHRYFHVKKFSLGNTLAFAKHFGVFNVIRQRHRFIFIHAPYLNQHGSKWKVLKTVVSHLPKDIIIESVAYNPRTKRIYIESETPNRIWSVPLDKLMNNKLVRKDLHIAKLTHRQEPEGLTFTRNGYAYLMFAHYHPWIASIYKTIKPVLM